MCLRTGSEKWQLRALGFSEEVKLTIPWSVEAPRTENSTGPSIQRWSGVFYRLADKSKWKFQFVTRART
jgi:hypothetical protein